MHQVTAPLFLASGSATRQQLLTHAEIPFELVAQNADESQCPLNQPLAQLVCQLAELKMAHVVYPTGMPDGQEAFFLTADTLTESSDGEYFGKPLDRRDAERMLRICRYGTTIVSGVCVSKARYTVAKGWREVTRVVEWDQGYCVIDIPESFLDFYLDRVPFTSVSGGITIEGFGEQFVREVRGSYSAILGLPMYKLRERLQQLRFFKDK